MNQTASVDGSKIPAFFSIATSFLIASCGATISAQADETVATAEVEQVSQVSAHASRDRCEALDAYTNDDLYVVIDVDIDMDGRLDKVVSSAQNKGDELIFFRNTEDGCHKALTSTNLTEDGGRILGDIKQEEGSGRMGEVVSIETFFPKGTDIATHYISYSSNVWMLSRTVYEVSDWKRSDNVNYICEVEQNIPMQDLISDEVVSRVRQIPDESVRDQVCTTKNSAEV